MYKINDNYKNYIETQTSLTPKSKIVVDDVEYLGDVIKSAPKITHKNSKMIGGFPIKTCSFEIYDFNNNLNFIGKEIYVYKGLVIDDNVEYILQGIFIPQEKDVETNISQRTIKFTNIQDKGQLFDVLFESKLDWSVKHTGLEIMQDICSPLNIELETTKFNWADYEFEQPNFPSNISRREVASRMAEIGGEIAFISRDGKLKIAEQNLTNHIIARKRYSTLTKEIPFIINTLSLGKEGIEDNIIFPETITEKRVEWNILDNPFVDLDRKDMIEKVAQYIIGKSMIPFTLKNFVDGFYLDINDVIEVKDKNGDTFNAVILNYETNSRINSDIGAETQSQQAIDYNLAGSNKKTLREVSLAVNNIEKNIKGVVETQDEQSKKMTELELNDKEITQKVTKVEETVEIIEQTADVYKIDIDTNAIFVYVNDNNSPLENKDYTKEFKTLFKNEEVTSVVTSESLNNGINLGITDKLTFSVDTETSIPSQENIFLINFKYVDGEEIYQKTATIMVVTLKVGVDYTPYINDLQNQLNEANSNLNDLNTTLTNDYMTSDQVNAQTDNLKQEIEITNTKMTELQTTIDGVTINIQTLGATISDMSYSFRTDALSIATSESKVNSRFDNTGVKVYNYETLMAIFNHRGSGVQDLIVVGTAQMAYLKFMKSTKNGKPITAIHHVVSEIHTLEDLEGDDTSG